MPSPSQILFLGICAGDRELIFEWAHQGVMPNIRRLMDASLVGLTNNVPLLYVQSVWPSFYTGTRPDKNGVHSWQQLKPGTYEQYRAFTPDLMLREPFWDYLSEAGRRCAIFDVPHSKPSTRLNGIQVVEWGAHDANHGFMTSPPELREQILARFGSHPLIGLCDTDRDAAQLAAFRDDLLQGIAGKVAMTRHFLGQGGWDLFAQVFTESHCAGHQCWHLHDPSHPRHKPADVAIAGDPLRDVYQGIDRGIGEILADVGDDTLVIVYAGHGMGPKYQGQYALAEVLIRLGVAEPAREASPPLADRLLPHNVVRTILSWGWQHTPLPLRQALRPGSRPPLERVRQDIDAAASKCFQIPNNNYGGIRVNLVGREPNGKVRPGAEYERFCRDLERDLLDLVNLADGKKLVRRVIRTAQVYNSEATAHFPDLLVEWGTETDVTGVASPKIGTINRGYDYCRTGDHRPGGFFIARGPGLAPGLLQRPVSILDFAPTFAAIFDTKIPDCDGTPIAELVEAGRRAASAQSRLAPPPAAGEAHVVLKR